MRKFGLVALLAAVCLGNGAEAQTFTLENVASIDTASDGIGAQRWDWLGTKIAYITSPGTNNTLYVIEPNDVLAKTLLAGSSEGVRADSAVAWSPNGEFVLYSSNKFVSSGNYLNVIQKVEVATQTVTDHVLDPDDLGLANESHRLVDPYVANRNGTYYLVVAVIGSPLAGKGVWAVQIDATGTPTGTPVQLVDGAFGLLRRPSYSPKSDRLYVEQPWTSTERKLWTVLGANTIVDGGTSAVTSAGDSRVHSVVNTATTNYKMNPQPSEDGWYVYWTEDVSGTYDESNSATFATANFEIRVDNILNISIDTWNSQTIARADNQGSISASPAGTRMCFAEGGSLVPGAATLYACSVGITHSVPANDGVDPGTVVTAATIDGYDGSGSFFAVPAGTVVGGLAAKAPDFTVQITTPISITSEIETAVSGVAVRRDFTPSGTTFTPAASLRLAYTDFEIEGLDESSLAVYVVSPPAAKMSGVTRADGSSAVGVKAMSSIEAAPILERDLTNNTLTVEVSHFSSFVMVPPGSVVQDSDSDGLSDDDETNVYNTNPNAADSDGDGRTDYQEVWYDGSGTYNPYNPTTNPTGTDTDANDNDSDDDGVMDGIEVSLGTDPMNGSDAPSVPAAAPLGYGILMLFLLLAGVYFTRQNFTKTA